MRIILLALCALSLVSCAPKISTQLSKTLPPLASSEPVVVIGVKEQAPADATEIGSIRIGDSGFSTDCGWNTVIEKAKQAARKAGGNMVKITKHTPPSVFGSSCHQISAKILKANAGIVLPGQDTAGKTTVIYTTQEPREFSKFKLSVHGGLSYLTARISNQIPSDFRPYMKDLKSGSHFGASGAWYFQETMGLGLRYSRFHTKNEIDVVAEDPTTGVLTAGKMRDDITIQFVGPSLNSRIISANKKVHYNFDFAVGYLGYKNRAMLIDPFTLTGGTAGLQFNFGADFLVSKHAAIGLELAYIRGALNSYAYDDGVQTQTIDLGENKENISRIDLSIGIRWIQ